MIYGDPLVPFLKAWEGLKLTPSRDPLNPNVIDVGHGHVIQPGETARAITRDEAHELLLWDMERKAEVVSELIVPALEQHQFDALLSWTFNLGAGNLRASTLLRKVNAGELDDVPEQMMRWVFAGHNDEPVPGLVKRRRAEIAIWRDGDYSGRP